MDSKNRSTVARPAWRIRQVEHRLLAVPTLGAARSYGTHLQDAGWPAAGHGRDNVPAYLNNPTIIVTPRNFKRNRHTPLHCCAG